MEKKSIFIMNVDIPHILFWKLWSSGLRCQLIMVNNP